MLEKIEQWKEEYTVVRHIFLDFKDYPNIKLEFPIGIFLIIFAIMLPIAIFFIHKRKNTLSFVARQLVRHEAKDEGSAKTLKALRLDTPTVRRALTRGGQLLALVSFAGRTMPSYNEYSKLSSKKRKNIDKIDFETAKIYIKDGEYRRAEALSSEGTSSIAKPIILSAISLIAFAVLFIFMPEILSALNDALV